MSILYDLVKSGNTVEVIDICNHPSIMSVSRLKIGKPLNQEFDVWSKTGSLIWFDESDPPVFLPGATMVPKKDDYVLINPDFILAMDSFLPNTWWVNVLLRDMAKNITLIHVDDVEVYSGEPSAEVKLGAPVNKTFGIRKNGTFYRLPENSAQMFLFENKKGYSIGTTSLKSLNTDGRATCAACGCQIKDPGMGPTYRYCPKCEP